MQRLRPNPFCSEKYGVQWGKAFKKNLYASTLHLPKRTQEELRGRVKEYSRELSAIFPQNTDFEKRCFDLLCRAYIEARYNKDCFVTKEEIAYMLERTEILKELTLRMCTEKIASYNTK